MLGTFINTIKVKYTGIFLRGDEEKLLARLTETERKAVKEYLNGLKPKEIASKLGISVRTVYKALWKYRKISGEKVVRAKRRRIVEPSPTVNRLFSDLIRVLSELNATLIELNRNIGRLANLLEARDITRSTVKRIDAQLPSFLQENPWIEVLRMRGRE
ncbi:MAG: sigma-70 region 4 domain-containing protein [Thermoproteales archaeon]|nr:sigma-70 region 4 domain-containing protein [Thermoproteales archaeon]